MEIFKKFTFVPPTAAQRAGRQMRTPPRPYLVTVYVSGPVDETTGWIMDFADLTARSNPFSIGSTIAISTRSRA